MAKNKGRAENLVPLTTEKAREIGRKGGQRSGEVKREKKRMSQIYGEFLAGTHEVEIDGDKVKLEGEKLVAYVMSQVLSRGDSSSVSMLKEIREATEGAKLELSGDKDKPVMVSIAEIMK